VLYAHMRALLYATGSARQGRELRVPSPSCTPKGGIIFTYIQTDVMTQEMRRAGRPCRQAGVGAARGQAARGEARRAALPSAGGRQSRWQRPKVISKAAASIYVLNGGYEAESCL